MLEKNPYTKAVNAYGAAQAETDQRSLEAGLLLKSARQLEDLAKRLSAGEEVHFEEVGGILDYNQKLWTVFVGDTMDDSHPLPQSIKNNIASLGVFIFNRTKDLMITCTHERIKVLIDINRNIASGLMKQASLAPAQQPAAAAATPAEKRLDADSLA